MIKPGLIFLLFAVCVLLTLGFFLIKGDRQDIKLPTDPGKPIVKPFDINSAQRITVKKGDATITLEKKDKNWIMTSLKDRAVNTERVVMLLSNLNLAKIEDTREGKETAFSLDEKNRTELTVDRGAEKTVLYLGKTVEGLKCFVRQEPTGPIFEVDKALDQNSGVRSEKADERVLDPAYFFDLKILAINADDLIDIVIKKDHDVVRLQKVIAGKGPLAPKQELGNDDPKPVWWITEPEGFAVDDNAVTRITSQLNINAKSYADTIPEKDRGFDKPTAKVKVRLKDGSEHTLVFGKVDNQDVFLQVDDRGDPYKIDKYVYDALVQKADDLKKKDTATPDNNAPRNDGQSQHGPPNGFPPNNGGNGGPPRNPANAPQLTPEQLEMIKRQIQSRQPIPAPPPMIEEKKPALPPAVVKPGEEQKKVDMPKGDELKK